MSPESEAAFTIDLCAVLELIESGHRASFSFSWMHSR